MNLVRGLELLFNIEKENFKSKEDCLVAALHCLLIFDENLKSKDDSLVATLHRLSIFQENLNCVGTGDEWTETDSVNTELLPEDWNSNQEVYSLRYSNRDKKTRILLKITKMEHILQVDAVMNKYIVANLPINVDDYISDDYGEYASAYKNLESLVESFRKDIIEKLNKPAESTNSIPHLIFKSSSVPSSPSQLPSHSRDPSQLPEDPSQPPKDPSQTSRYPRVGGIDVDPYDDPGERSSLRPLRNPFQRAWYPRVGGNDLHPGGGFGTRGMFLDPSDLGIPPGPTLPEFGVGSPGGLPREAVPPGARYDPIIPPIMRPNTRRSPSPDLDPDLYPPPDFEDDIP